MVALTENRLSVHAQDHSLKDILEQIAALSAVPIMISETIKDQVISSHFDDVALEEGLRRLLYRLDAFFFYAVEGADAAALQAVWVYPQGQGKRMLPMPPEAWASMAEMRQYLRDPDPEMRARAAETLVERQGKRALEAVLEALEDGEEKVRYRALARAVQGGVPLRGDMLHHLLRRDPSPVVRFLAFEALAKAPDVPPQMLWESAHGLSMTSTRPFGKRRRTCWRNSIWPGHQASPVTPYKNNSRGTAHRGRLPFLEYAPAAGVCSGPPDGLGREFMWSFYLVILCRLRR